MPHRHPRTGRPSPEAARPGPRRTSHRRARWSPARAVALVLVPLVVLGACTGDDGADGPAGTATSVPPAAAIPAEDASTPTITVPDGFVAPDTRGVALTPVVGDPQPPPDAEANVVPVDGGEAELRALVVGPEGPVDGAVVRFERFVGPLRGWRDVAADGDGVATLAEAQGGRYRIRAWLAPTLTSTESQTAFVARTEELDLRVRVEPHEAPVLQGALTVPAWSVADTAAFEALLVRESVDEVGIIQGEPLLGDVTLTPIAGARVDTPNPRPTDPETGRASFGVVCLVPGIHDAVLTVGELTTTVALPECRPSPATPPPAPDPAAPLPEPPPPGVAVPPAVAVADPAAVTAAAEAALGVGGTFAPPFDGPIPAGTYEAVAISGACPMTFELLAGDRWVPQSTSGDRLVLSSPARTFRAEEGTPACTFRRAA